MVSESSRSFESKRSAIEQSTMIVFAAFAFAMCACDFQCVDTFLA